MPASQGGTKPWPVRRIRYGDILEQVAELARVAYSPDVPLARLDYLRWKYLENPAGSAIAVGCEIDGQLMGFTGLFPLVMKIGEEPTKRCAFPGDTMVHPNFQRQGMYTAMKHYSAETVMQDLSMVYSRTRWLEQPTVRGELKYLPVNHIGKVSALMKILSPVSGDSSIGSERVKVREIAPLVFDSEFDELWWRVKDSFQVAVVRGKDFLNWRFSMPGYTYTGLRADEDGVLSGYCVMIYVPYRTSHRTYYASDELRACMIPDILATSSEVAGSLIEAAIDRARKDQIQVMMMLETEQTKHFSGQLGFRQAWEETLMALVRSPEIPEDLVANMSNWYTTFGDSDWA